METIFVLLPLALLIAAIAVGFFIWAARSGQFDDLDTPAVRILFDDEVPASARPVNGEDGLRRGRPASARPANSEGVLRRGETNAGDEAGGPRSEACGPKPAV
jgi:cbb3-type cytochrome oxidase maturation protein